MNKRNKLQGKHAAHAKQTEEKAPGSSTSFEPPYSSIADGDAARACGSSPSIKVPEINAHSARGIDLPEIGDGAVDFGETRRMDPVGGFANLKTESNLPPVSPGDFTRSSFWNPANQDTGSEGAGGKKAAIVVGSILGVIVLAYLIGVFVFNGRFYPNTTIGGQDISMMNMGDAAAVVEKIGSDYSVKVEGEGLNFSISSKEMGIDIDGEKVVSNAHASLSSWGWPVHMLGGNDLTDSLAAEYNANGIKQIVDEKVGAVNVDAKDPVNAAVAYNDEANTFEVSSEEVGTKLDAAKVLESVDEAVIEMAPKAQITADDLMQPTVFKDDERLAKAAEEANGYIGAKLDLKMGDYDAGTVDADQISGWVTFDDDYAVSFDEEAMNEWLKKLGNSLDTIGSSRTYTRPDGKEVTVEGGTYGWEIDSEALASAVRDEIKAGTQGNVDVPVIASGVYYDAKNGVDWADYIDVDLAEQHARYITESGDVSWESDVVTGTPDGEHDTPTGVWTLFSMESPATLKGDIQVATGQPEYETKVQYWMPFTYSGCGLHDATWQPAFGGDLYAQGYGSHGCVNLPLDAAESLFNKASVGIPVIVHW